MPCDTQLREEQTLEDRNREITRALARLEAALDAGRVKLQIAANGAIAFGEWKDRDGVSDVCAYRTLTAGNSWALKQAVQRAEAQQGRKVNPTAVAAGWHTHDAGTTWSKH